MNWYESNKHLKEAIVGYVSAVWSRIKQMFRFQSAKKFLERKITESMIAYSDAVKAMPGEKQALFSALAGMKHSRYKMENVFPLNLISLENRIREIFCQFGIELDFLSDFNMGVMEFAYFVVELSDRIKEKHKDNDDVNEEEVIKETARCLIVERYVQVDIAFADIIFERMGSIDVIHTIAVSLKRVLHIHVVDANNSNKEIISFHQEENIRFLQVTPDQKRDVIGIKSLEDSNRKRG